MRPLAANNRALAKKRRDAVNSGGTVQGTRFFVEALPRLRARGERGASAATGATTALEKGFKAFSAAAESALRAETIFSLVFRQRCVQTWVRRVVRILGWKVGGWRGRRKDQDITLSV